MANIADRYDWNASRQSYAIQSMGIMRFQFSVSIHMQTSRDCPRGAVGSRAHIENSDWLAGFQPTSQCLSINCVH
jgi:hypothetical protein